MIRLFYRGPSARVQELLDGRYSEKFYLSNNPKHPDFYAQMARRNQVLELLEFQIDMTVNELCRYYEVNSCIGKETRWFAIPSAVVKKIEITRKPSDFEPGKIWNDYPGKNEMQTRVSNSEQIYLVGAPEIDLRRPIDNLKNYGFDIQVGGVRSGSNVIFCFTALEDTKDLSWLDTSIAKIRPLALLLTEFEKIDEYLLDMVVLQLKEDLLPRVLPHQRVESLATLIGGDPYLGDRVQGLLDANLQEVEYIS